MRKTECRRVLSGLLAAAMVVGLIPVLPGLIPSAAAVTETDAYGFDLTRPDKSVFDPDDGQNPYGSGKFNFNPVTELNVYEGGGSGQNSATYDLDAVNDADALFGSGSLTQISSSLTASAKYTNSTNHLMHANGVAFDPTGSGRDDYIMYYGFSRGSGNNTPYTFLLKADADSGELPRSQPAGGVSGNTGNAFRWVDNLDRDNGTGYTSIAAGDFDGDGRDSVVYYVPGDNTYGVDMTLQEQTFSASGAMDSARQVLNVGNLRYGNRTYSTIQHYGTDNWDDYNECVERNTAMVYLSAADVDSDNKDELLVTISLGDLFRENASALTDRSSVLIVMDQNNGAWSQTYAQQMTGIQSTEQVGKHTGAYYLRSASSEAGDIDGDGNMEIVTLGSGGYGQSNNEDLVAGTVMLAIITECENGAYSVRTNGEGRIVGNVLRNQQQGNWVGFWSDNASLAPQPLALAAFDGFGTAEYIVARGKIYQYNTDNGTIGMLDVDDDIYSLLSTCYGMGRPVVGNFDGNAEGREQVLFALERGTNGNNFRIGGFRYQPTSGGSGSLSTDTRGLEAANKLANITQGWHHNSLCLVAADADTNDGMMAQYESKEYTYTDPEVMAILEASPYFGDLREEYSDNPGSTSFGLGSGSSAGSSETASTTAGAYFSFEQDFSVFGVTVASMEMEAAYEAQWDEEYAMDTTYETQMSFNTGPNENQVVLLRTPVIVYHYTAWDTNGNEFDMHVSSAQQPSYVMMSVEEYNAAASGMGGDVIGEDIISNTPGVPGSYRSSMSEFGANATAAQSASIAAGYGGGTTELTVTKATSSTLTTSLTHSITTKAGAGAGGLTIGASGGTASGTGKSVTDTTSVTRAGEVMQIPSQYQGSYGFNWNLVTWDATLGRGEDSYTVPVVSYLVTNVVEPPAVPQNAYAESNENGTAVTVSWEGGYNSASRYEVYRYLGDSAPNPYYLIGSVDGGDDHEGVYSFADEEVQPGEEYEYSVRAVGADGRVSNYSSPISVWTASDSVITITKPPRNIGVLPGGSAAFQAEVNAPSGVNLSMIWQQRQAGSSAWQTIPNTSGNTLRLNGVTTEMDGNQYRLLVTAMQDGEPSYLYSSSATLSVGRVDSTTTLTADTGESGQATHTVTDRTETDTVANSVYRLGSDSYTRYANVYAGNPDTDYVYLGTDGYYLLDGVEFHHESDTIFVGEGGRRTALTSLANRLVTDGNRVYGLLNDLHSTIQSTQAIGPEGSAVTYNVFTVRGIAIPATEAGTSEEEVQVGAQDISVLTLYQKADGPDDTFYVQLEGDFDADGTMILTPVTPDADGSETTLANLTYFGTPEADWADETETENGYAVYRVGDTDANVYTLGSDTAIRYFTRDTAGEYVPLTLPDADEFGTVDEFGMISNRVRLGEASTTRYTVINESSRTVNGDPVTLTATVTNGSGAAVSGLIEFEIVNNATGVKSGGTASINENGQAFWTWTPAEPGVYTITAQYQGNDQLLVSLGELTYYAYGEQTADGSADGYELVQPESLVYGNALDFRVNHWTIKDGERNDSLSADYDFTAYRYTDGRYQEETGWSNGSILLPGDYRIEAESGGTVVASKLVTVSRRALTVSVPAIDPIRSENLEDYDWDAVALVFDGLIAGDDYRGLFHLNHDNVAAAAGSYPLSVAVDTDDPGYSSLTAKYSLTLQDGTVRVTVGEVQVNYAAGEGGALAVRNQSSSAEEVASGSTVPVGSTITFTAEPAQGYEVSGWTINGRVWTGGVDGAIGSIQIDWDNYNQLRVENLSDEIDVQVQFGTGTHAVSFGVEQGAEAFGSLTAQYRDEALESGKQVVSGSPVVFTAQPAGEEYIITRWTVNDRVQTEADGSNYTGDTLTIYSIDADTHVTVAFGQYEELTVDYGAGPGGTLQADVDSGAVVGTGGAVAFTAEPDAGNMVAKWSVKWGDGAFADVTRDNMDELGVHMDHHLSGGLTANMTDDLEVRVSFEPYMGYAVPVGEPGVYTIRDDVAVHPADPAREDEVRRGGDLTFTIVPDDAAAGSMDGLAVNGWDCFTQSGEPQGCESVSSVKNADGSYTVTITGVSGDISIVPVTHQMNIDEGLAGYEIPQALIDKGFDTVDRIQSALHASFTGSEDGIAFYDIALQYWNGTAWADVSEDSFPEEGVDVTLPYPDGTDSRDTFAVAHMLSAGADAGQVELLEVSNTENGLVFHTDSLSPFAVSWTRYEEPDEPGGGSGGGGGGGGGSLAEVFDVAVPDSVRNGAVSVSPARAEAGKTVTITVSPDEGYALDQLTVTDEDGNEIRLTDAGNGRYTFTMPESDIRIAVSFAEAGQPAEMPFTDVAENAWYADAVQYVYENSMMTGMTDTTFGPDATTTRSMIVTILHRLEGAPAASGSRFTDVAQGAYYADAVAWAAENGIVNGIRETAFAPDQVITREQLAAILYRYAQYKDYDVTASGSLDAYTDASEISAYAADAMQWANGQGLITGVTDTTLDPQGSATRAQAATILMRFREDVAK